MQQYRIRAFTNADAAGLVQVFRESVQGLTQADYSAEQRDAWLSLGPDAEGVAKRCSDGRITLVAVGAQDQPVAYIDLEADGHIDNLYCTPEASGCGLAHELYAQVERTARSLGCVRLYTEASETARRFFLSRGFQLRARREIRIGAVLLHNFRMEKRLT